MQVDATKVSLQDLTNPKQMDMKKSLDNYKTNVTIYAEAGKTICINLLQT